MNKKEVYGKLIDENTRCTHYHSPLDIIAIKFKCCDKYYPCYECHKEIAGHDARVWSKTERNNKAILCGICKTEMTIEQYLRSGDLCPTCQSPFNPNCSKHYHLYFEL